MAKAVSSINLADGAEANSNAKKVATNYLASDSTGIMVAELSGSSETPSTATGNNVRITSTTVDVRKGQNNLTTMGQSGMQIYNGYGTQIANLGYGPGKDEDGNTDNAPYYDLGIRESNTVVGNYSVAEGKNVTASGYCSHAQGINTITTEFAGTVLGMNNKSTSGYAVVVGGGAGHEASSRRDILTVDWGGNVFVTGHIVQTTKAYYNGNATGVTNFWNSAIQTRTTADFYRMGNTVFCYLRFTSPSTVSSSQAIATIPSGFRPNHVCCFTASIAWENGTNCPITIGTSGAVAFVNTAFTASKSYIVCGTWLTDDDWWSQV